MKRVGWAVMVVGLSGVLFPLSAQDQIDSYTPDFFASSRPATAMDMISRLPGFSFEGGDGSRGFSGNAGNVLINGKRPTSKTDGLFQVLQRIVAGDVERIDVIRGGAPGIDMQGKPVVANVIRKTADSTNIVVSAGLFTFHTGRVIPSAQLQYSRTIDDRSYEFSIRRDANFNDDMGAADITHIDSAGTAVLTNQQRRGTGGNIGVNSAIKLPLLGGDFGANATVNHNEFSNDTLYEYAAGAQQFSSTNRNQNAELGANYQMELGDATLDMVGLQRVGHQVSTQILNNGGGDDRFSSLRDTGESIARFSLRYPLNDELTAEGGAEIAYNTLEGEAVLRQGGSVVTLPSSLVEVNEKRGEAFLQASWQAREDLTLEGGLRAEYSTITSSGPTGQSRSFFYPKPRIQLAWNITPDALLRLRLEKRVGQLNFGDFVSSANLTQNNITAGNPELHPDQRWQYEMVYEHHFWERGAFTVTLMHQEITDLIDNKVLVTSTGTFDVRGNIGDATSERLGVETTIPTDRFGIKGGLLNLEANWRDSALTDPVTGLSRRFSFEDAASYEVRFSQDLEEWKSTWSVAYNHGWKEIGYRLSQIDRFYGDPWINASWTYKPSADLNLTFSANNILPPSRRRDTLYFSGPRNSAALLRQEIEVGYSRPRFQINLRKTFN